MPDLPQSASGRTAAEVARACAREAGRMAMAAFGARQDVRVKGRGNFLTETDLATERAILALLREEYPDHAVLAEETAGQAPREGWLWVIDPLDGTHNFSRGIPYFATNIALCHDGEPLLGLTYAPATGEEFFAQRGAGLTGNRKPAGGAGGGRAAGGGSGPGRRGGWGGCSRWPATAPGGGSPLRPQGAVERDGRGDPLHHHRPHLLEGDARQAVADAPHGRLRREHLAGRGQLHDPGGDVHVVAHQVVAPLCRLPVVDAHAHPQGQLLGRGLAVEPLLEGERHGDGPAGVIEPEHQAVAQLLDDAPEVVHLLADQPFLEGEELQGGLIAPHGGELREAGDVRKDDSARDGPDGGSAGRAHGPVTSTEPEKVLALMSKSVPWGQSQWSLPESVRTLTCGRLPSATRTMTRPEMDLTSTSSSPAGPSSTLPLRVETRAAFSTLPMRMRPLFF